MWRWLTAALVLLAGALLCAQAVRLLAAGYSRAGVIHQLEAVAGPLWLCVGAAAVGLVLQARMGDGRPRAAISPGEQLRSLMALLPMQHDEGQADDAAILRREERFRRRAWVACGGVCLVAAAVCGRYLLDPAHFATMDVDAAVGRMLWVLGPWTAAALAAMCVAEACGDASARRALPAARRLAAASKVRALPAPAKGRRGGVALRAALYAAAFALIVLGVLNGGMRDVLIKAINICTECIGLG